MKNTVKFLFSLILPFTVVIIIPLAIEDDFAVRRDLLSMAGALLGVFGLALLVLTVSMFARLGNGTLAPGCRQPGSLSPAYILTCGIR